MVREYEGHLRKELRLKENLNKPIDPSGSSLRLTGEVQIVLKFSLAVSVLYKLFVVFCPSHRLGVSK